MRVSTNGGPLCHSFQVFQTGNPLAKKCKMPVTPRLRSMRLDLHPNKFSFWISHEYVPDMKKCQIHHIWRKSRGFLPLSIVSVCLISQGQYVPLESNGSPILMVKFHHRSAVFNHIAKVQTPGAKETTGKHPESTTRRRPNFEMYKDNMQGTTLW